MFACPVQIQTSPTRTFLRSTRLFPVTTSDAGVALALKGPSFTCQRLNGLGNCRNAATLTFCP